MKDFYGITEANIAGKPKTSEFDYSRFKTCKKKIDCNCCISK